MNNTGENRAFVRSRSSIVRSGSRRFQSDNAPPALTKCAFLNTAAIPIEIARTARQLRHLRVQELTNWRQFTPATYLSFFGSPEFEIGGTTIFFSSSKTAEDL